MPPNCLDDLPSKRAVQNHRIFHERPGQVFDAYDQCQLLLKDKDAELFSVRNLPESCERIKCKSPNRIGYYYAGPALEGTFCGNKRWCISGSCRPWSNPAPPVIQGGWGEWNVSACASGCVDKALGVSIARRRCDSPKPLNTEDRCLGAASHVEFCEDDTLCNYRLTAKEFASQKCREFSQLVDDIRSSGVGIQVPYTESKPWSACSIYCKLNSGTWYTPRQDLNDMGVDTYFPDGTWCHNDGLSDYYCQLHECRPKIGAVSQDEAGDEEAAAPPPLNVLQNALSRPAQLPEALSVMHQLDSQLRPLQPDQPPEFAPADSQEAFGEQDVMTIDDIKELMAKQQ
ncbi:A disintegrin and metalloproteinase with thrombospondin motifs adt-2-like [Pollicipes pollicipes]|nr:A disintegrin and metalloproteinase with thrombospondin motifs adt-2-like [Pollicipes pollicipes]